MHPSIQGNLLAAEWITVLKIVPEGCAIRQRVQYIAQSVTMHI